MKLILIFFCFAVLPAEQRYLFDFLASELSLGGLRAAASRRQPAQRRDERPRKQTNEAEDKRVELVCFLFVSGNPANKFNLLNLIDGWSGKRKANQWSPTQAAKSCAASRANGIQSIVAFGRWPAQLMDGKRD